MRHSIPHDLPRETARRATRAALESYQRDLAEYKPTGTWVSEDHAKVSFTVAGRTLNGSVAVQPRAVELELDVPLLLRPFKGMAMKVVQEEIERWLERARQGEFDS